MKGVRTEAEQVERRSFVYGNAVISNPLVTRKMVDEVIAEVDEEDATKESK